MTVVETVQIVAANQWDVNISLEDARRFAQKVYAFRHRNKTQDSETEHIIQQIFYSNLGQPAGFDDEDIYFESEYVSKYGLEFSWENIKKMG